MNNALQYFPKVASLRGLARVTGYCDKHGGFTADVMPGSAPLCLRCDFENEAARRVAERRRAELWGCGVPGKFRQAKFRDLIEICPEQVAVLQAFKGWVARVGKDRNAGNVVMVGSTGTGKTHMASAAALNLISHCGLEVRYVTSDQMRVEVCETWGKPGRSENTELRRLAMYPLLIIDEIDILDANGHGLRILNRVIDARSVEGLPTVFISNQTQERLTDIVGVRAVSRMYENALVLQCYWEDFRARGLKR
ncbi:ATP-binding protein [Chromobacterium amazonense]|uniref:ATP-binding protein n=1 Tax=Chromobacterium amazonense TaxID=1382803 RepID=UPI00167031EC|nr:ATP-binding protein [Chromobacterium amazonense]